MVDEVHQTYRCLGRGCETCSKIILTPKEVHRRLIFMSQFVEAFPGDFTSPRTNQNPQHHVFQHPRGSGRTCIFAFGASSSGENVLEGLDSVLDWVAKSQVSPLHIYFLFQLTPRTVMATKRLLLASSI